MIGHLVIVAGVSGSGKSTLVERMQRGDGPLDLRGWRAVSTRTLPAWKRADYDGLILDYDINDLSEAPLAICEQACRITVVNVRPPRETIIRQLESREARAEATQAAQQARLRWRAAKLLLDCVGYVSPAVEKVLRRYTPYRVKHRRQRMERKLASYTDDTLADLYRRWDARTMRLANATVIAA